MNLIIIYGPPAVGKLTVSNELAKLTSYKVLHNHLVIDLINSIFDRNDEMFGKLIDSYRLDLVEKAAVKKINGLILTTVNIKNEDDLFIKNLIKINEQNFGKTYFIQLTCDINEIKKRLTATSRNKHGKLTDVKIFEDFISKKEILGAIPFVESLKIDNTFISPQETANIIKKHYNL
jgi:broad-specificity NMP kinase